jgi:hypothetical protein
MGCSFAIFPKGIFLLLQSRSTKCLNFASFKQVNLMFKPAALHDMVVLRELAVLLLRVSFCLILGLGTNSEFKL